MEKKRIQHLELIQNVIERLVGNEFLVKGWAFTVAGVLLGFAVNNHSAMIAVVSLLPTLLFAGYDLYLLRTERRYRVLYNRVRTSQPAAGEYAPVPWRSRASRLWSWWNRLPPEDHSDEQFFMAPTSIPLEVLNTSRARASLQVDRVSTAIIVVLLHTVGCGNHRIRHRDS
jgi:hypothetical protein